MREAKIQLLDHQWEALQSSHKFTLMLCGIGSGKSFTGACWVLKKIKESPASIGLITANTYGQLQKATLTTVFGVLNGLEIPYQYNQNKAVLTVFKKKFFCLSLDNYDNHRGIEVGEWWADECAYNDEEAFKVMSGRLRDKNGKLDVLFTTTPKGLNWLYEYFSPTGSKYDPTLYKTIIAKTTDNRHLPSEYIQTLRTQYDSKMAKQELDAEWINVAQGQAYYQFSRENNIKDTIVDSNKIFYAFVDFNVDPLTGLIAQFIDDKIIVHDEIFQRNSNTQALAREIKQKVGIAYVIPDSTGRNRKTSGQSDFMILEGEGLLVMETLNPRVVDRVGNLNRLLEQGRIIINPKCVKLINDLERVCWRENSFELDQKRDKLLSHISDALGYGANKLMPLEKNIESRTFKY